MGNNYDATIYYRMFCLTWTEPKKEAIFNFLLQILHMAGQQ